MRILLFSRTELKAFYQFLWIIDGLVAFLERSERDLKLEYRGVLKIFPRFIGRATFVNASPECEISKPDLHFAEKTERKK